jgi:hypothetical protein
MPLRQAPGVHRYSSPPPTAESMGTFPDFPHLSLDKPQLSTSVISITTIETFSN